MACFVWPTIQLKKYSLYSKQKIISIVNIIIINNNNKAKKSIESSDFIRWNGIFFKTYMLVKMIEGVLSFL